MEKITLETIQSRALLDIDEVRPLDDGDFQVLREMGDVLRKHGCTDRFGVCLLHKHFDLAEGEELVEETDVERRVSTIAVRKAASDRGSTIETLWRFTTGINAITKCVLTCNYNWGHKRVHVKQGA